MKNMLSVVGQSLREHGAAAVAGTLAGSGRSVWPVLAVLTVVLGQKLCDAALPALRELLLRVVHEVGPAIGQELRTDFQAWCERRRRRRRRRRR
jgi:hypothetical protein